MAKLHVVLPKGNRTVQPAERQRGEAHRTCAARAEPRPGMSKHGCLRMKGDSPRRCNKKGLTALFVLEFAQQTPGRNALGESKRSAPSIMPRRKP